MTKLKYSNCDKTQELKLLQNSKPQIVNKLKNSNRDIQIVEKKLKTQIVTKLKTK